MSAISPYSASQARFGFFGFGKDKPKAAIKETPKEDHGFVRDVVVDATSAILTNKLAGNFGLSGKLAMFAGFLAPHLSKRVDGVVNWAYDRAEGLLAKVNPFGKNDFATESP